MVVLFWCAAAFIGYVYAGYPLLLWIWARLRPRRVAESVAPPVGVTIIVAARNEGDRLRARIDNLLQLDYPPSARQIVIVSDGSNDGTETVVAPYADVVDFVRVPAGGKALALNAGVARARFDVLVFTDARQQFAADALVELTRPLQDPAVGGVTGELLLDCESSWRRTAGRDRRRAPRAGASDRRRTAASTISVGVGVYWRYEKMLRRLESAVSSTLGATGAIYALRRALWSSLPPDTILDDVLAPMRAVLAGYRIVFNPRARAFDRTAGDADAEAQRKIRTLAGNYQILRLEPWLLSPWRNPVWLQYVSHKLGRLLVPYALLLFFVASIASAERHPVYLAALVAQCACYLLAGYGAWLEFRVKAALPAPVKVIVSANKEVVNA
jgi:cellulose synthase/poly-beta-1,6-N-acetylglucosamine synthase-like glycosyltransferase